MRAVVRFETSLRGVRGLAGIHSLLLVASWQHHSSNLLWRRLAHRFDEGTITTTSAGSSASLVSSLRRAATIYSNDRVLKVGGWEKVKREERVSTSSPFSLLPPHDNLNSSRQRSERPL